MSLTKKVFGTDKKSGRAVYEYRIETLGLRAEHLHAIECVGNGGDGNPCLPCHILNRYFLLCHWLLPSYIYRVFLSFSYYMVFLSKNQRYRNGIFHNSLL